MLFVGLSCNSNSTVRNSPVPVQKNRPLEFQDSSTVNQYVDGKKEGLWRDQYSSGLLKSEFLYQKGNREGIGREWWKNGKLSTEGMYKEDQANGLMKWYNERGHLAAIGEMINDKRNGEWKIRDWQDSTFYTIGKFKDDVEYGPWRSYHENGQLEHENVWYDGEIVSSRCWDRAGVKVECER